MKIIKKLKNIKTICRNNETNKEKVIQKVKEYQKEKIIEKNKKIL